MILLSFRVIFVLIELFEWNHWCFPWGRPQGYRLLDDDMKRCTFTPWETKRRKKRNIFIFSDAFYKFTRIKSYFIINKAMCRFLIVERKAKEKVVKLSICHTSHSIIHRNERECRGRGRMTSKKGLTRTIKANTMLKTEWKLYFGTHAAKQQINWRMRRKIIIELYWFYAFT